MKILPILAFKHSLRQFCEPFAWILLVFSLSGALFLTFIWQQTRDSLIDLGLQAASYTLNKKESQSGDVIAILRELYSRPGVKAILGGRDLHQVLKTPEAQILLNNPEVKEMLNGQDPQKLADILTNPDMDLSQSTKNLTEESSFFKLCRDISIIFTPFGTLMSMIFINKLAWSSERRFRLKPVRAPVGRQIWFGLTLGGNMIALSVLALILGNFWPIFTWVLNFFINGYLLGRGFFGAVAIRRMNNKEEAEEWQILREPALLCGMGLSLIFSLPFVFILAPLLAPGVMVYLLHSQNNIDA